VVRLSEFVGVARLEEVPPGEARRVVVQGRVIAVYNVEGELFATDDTCTHAQASLSEGELEGHVIHCPLHGARFDVRTGRVLSPPAYRPLRRYEVQAVDGEIRIKL